MKADNELLRQYATARSEDAFAELVKRHVDLVYSAALRQVAGDAHLAHDIVQSVFTDLARKAGLLCGRESLTGWLYTSTHFAAAKIVRTETRRRKREEQFMRAPSHDTTADADWEQLRPILDSAMHGLNESDREAVLLRYFENQPYAEVGAKLGVNENTARMRVERALEKLRALLAKRGITIATTLSAIVSANAVQVAPAHLAAAIATTSTVAASAGTITLLEIMSATTLKLAAGTLAVAGVTTALVLQHRTEARLLSENGTLQQQVAQLRTENENISNSVLSAKNAQALSQDQMNELLRLRGQVGDLKQQLADAAQARAKLAAAQSASTSSTNDPESLDMQMRTRTMIAAKTLAAAAMMGYAERHKGQFPTNWNQIRGDFDTWERQGLNPGDVMPDTEADFAWVTNQYEFVYQGTTKALYDATNFGDTIVVRQKEPWQALNGKWVKTYGFADGHSQLMAEPPEGFSAWESQHMASPPAN